MEVHNRQSCASWHLGFTATSAEWISGLQRYIGMKALLGVGHCFTCFGGLTLRFALRAESVCFGGCAAEVDMQVGLLVEVCTAESLE